MPEHRDLTGASLHESKGVDAAAADTVYVANGAGSGTWSKLPAAAVDTTSIKNSNEFTVTVRVSDIANPSVVVVPVPLNATLVSADSCITAAISGGDSLLTFQREGSATIGTITIAASGSGEGVLDTMTAPANNIFTGPSWLKISCNGAPTGGTSDAFVFIRFRYN